jgi:hypothetical protein
MAAEARVLRPAPNRLTGVFKKRRRARDLALTKKIRASRQLKAEIIVLNQSHARR